MKRLSLIASALAVLGLTACEKTVVSTDRPLVDDRRRGFRRGDNRSQRHLVTFASFG